MPAFYEERAERGHISNGGNGPGGATIAVEQPIYVFSCAGNTMSKWRLIVAGVLIAAPVLVAHLEGQPGPEFGKKGGFGFKGGPPFGERRKLLEQFDKNGDGWLDNEERAAARAFVKKDQPAGGFGFGGPPKGGFGPPGFGKGNREPSKPGPRVAPADVKSYPEAGLYEPTVLRTLFLEFENDDWEAELADFYHTDVDVPATLTVDGKRYPQVGVHFRGMSSYFAVPAGYKRSLNLSLDFAGSEQRLFGYKTLNLLNGHDDPGLMSAVLYSHIGRQYIPTPRANFVKVVINGESWGVYTNQQQFNKDFLKENYKTSKGTRWKVRGSPGGGGGLDYIGDNVEEYKRRYEIKSAKADEKAWEALVALCKTLSQTPPDKLEAALEPIMDIDGLLWFLALDVALINCDGYWLRASDYSLYRDPKGKFHVIPNDINEAFRPAQGPGFGGPGFGGPGFGGPGFGGPGGFGPPGFGPPGGFGPFGMRPPTPGEVLPSPLQDMLQLTDEQKRKLAELQKEVEKQLDKLLSNEQRAQLKKLREGGSIGGFPGPKGGPMVGGKSAMEIEPLVAMQDPRKPLRTKVLAVPSLQKRYLEHIKAIADKALDWKNLGPVVAQYRSLIEKEVAMDTRKLDSLAEFQHLTADAAGAAEPERRFGPPSLPLRAFADQRRAYLLNHPDVKKAVP
jgi:spore coat protein CotH